MLTAERLDEALRIARNAGLEVRFEWLDGRGCDVCEVKGRKILFVDLAQTTAEQYDDVVETLQQTGVAASPQPSHEQRMPSPPKANRPAA